MLSDLWMGGTKHIYRHGLIFQIPLSNHSSRRYAVHPDGSGTGWAEDAPDIGQPHGLDYRSHQDLRKGVRKRVSKEHKTLADATGGGEHLPGGCRVLAIVETTADLTKGAGDASYDVTDGKFIGRGLIYDQTENSLWCFTNSDGTTSNNPYRLKWGPASICTGSDFTWGAAHEFDASVDISGTLQLATGFIVDATTASFGGTAGIGLFFDPTAYAGEESITFPNGLIFKHGYVATGGVGVIKAIIFGTPFPTALISAQATIYRADGLWCYAPMITANGVNGMTIVAADSFTNGYFWQAWGR